MDNFYFEFKNGYEKNNPIRKTIIQAIDRTTATAILKRRFPFAVIVKSHLIKTSKENLLIAGEDY